MVRTCTHLQYTPTSANIFYRRKEHNLYPDGRNISLLALQQFFKLRYHFVAEQSLTSHQTSISKFYSLAGQFKGTFKYEKCNYGYEDGIWERQNCPKIKPIYGYIILGVVVNIFKHFRNKYRH